MKRYVVFQRALRGDNAECINHVTNDEQTRTLCGRTGWEAMEEPFNPDLGVDCRTCTRALAKLAETARSGPT